MPRHTHTPPENLMLADAYLDVVERKMTLQEASDYLCGQYPHHPSPSTVSTYLGAAKNCYENIKAGADDNDVKWRYSRELHKQMRLAIAKRTGGKKPVVHKKQ